MYLSTCCKAPIKTSGLSFICSAVGCGVAITNTTDRQGIYRGMYEFVENKPLQQPETVGRYESMVIELLKIVRDMVRPLIPDRNREKVERLAKEIVLDVIKSVARKIATNEEIPDIRKMLGSEETKSEFELVEVKKEPEEAPVKYDNVLVMTRSERLPDGGYTISCECG